MHRKVSVDRWHAGARDDRVDFVAEEVPVALTYNRHAHVVMMATPSDLEDFALGFSLSEGIVRDPSELLAVRVLERDQGLEVAMTVSSQAQETLSRQRRNLAGRTGCGLCGAESIEQAMRRPEPVSNALRLPPSATSKPSRHWMQGILCSPEPARCTARAGLTCVGGWCTRERMWAGTTPWTS